jgi:hypothetical protein
MWRRATWCKIYQVVEEPFSYAAILKMDEVRAEIRLLLGGWENHEKKDVRIVDVPAEIRIWHLQNMSEMLYLEPTFVT